MVSGVSTAKIKLLGWEWAIVPLADMTDEVILRSKKSGKGLFGWSFPSLEATTTVARHPLSREERSPTDSTNRGRDVVV